MLRTSLARDAEGEGKVAELSRKMKAIQAAIFSTMGFEEEGVLMMRKGQGVVGPRCGPPLREVHVTSRRHGLRGWGGKWSAV